MIFKNVFGKKVINGLKEEMRDIVDKMKIEIEEELVNINS